MSFEKASSYIQDCYLVEQMEADKKATKQRKTRVITAEMRHKYYVKHYYGKKDKALNFLKKRLDCIVVKEAELQKEREEIQAKMNDILRIRGELDDSVSTTSEQSSETIASEDVARF
jgi:hypothetical protein